MKPTLSPWPARACQAAALAAMAATIGILLGSLDFRTRWEDPGGGYGFDRFIHWGAESALLGSVALLILLLIFEGLRDHRRTDRSWLSRAAARSLVAVACCAGAAWIARWYWQSLLSGSAIPGVDVFIAGGLPVVVTAGAAGSALALLLAVVLWWQRSQVTSQTAPVASGPARAPHLQAPPGRVPPGRR